MKSVNDNVCKDRLITFQKKAEQIKMDYRKKLFDKKSLVMFENDLRDKKKFFGRDEFLNSVIVSSKSNLKGKIKDVKIIGGNLNTLFGELSVNQDKKSFAA